MLKVCHFPCLKSVLYLFLINQYLNRHPTPKIFHGVWSKYPMWNGIPHESRIHTCRVTSDVSIRVQQQNEESMQLKQQSLKLHWEPNPFSDGNWCWSNHIQTSTPQFLISHFTHFLPILSSHLDFKKCSIATFSSFLYFCLLQQQNRRLCMYPKFFVVQLSFKGKHQLLLTKQDAKAGIELLMFRKCEY